MEILDHFIGMVRWNFKNDSWTWWISVAWFTDWWNIICCRRSSSKNVPGLTTTETDADVDQSIEEQGGQATADALRQEQAERSK